MVMSGLCTGLQLMDGISTEGKGKGKGKGSCWKQEKTKEREIYDILGNGRRTGLSERPGISS